MAFQLFNTDIGGSAIGEGISKLGAGIATGEDKDKMVASRAKQYEKLVQAMNESFGDKSPFKGVDLHGMNRYDMAQALADSHTMIDSFSKFQEQQAQAQYRQAEAEKLQALTENLQLQNEGIKKLLAGGESTEPKFNTPAAAALYQKNKQALQAKEDAKNLGIDPTPFIKAAETLQKYHTETQKFQEEQQKSLATASSLSGVVPSMGGPLFANKEPLPQFPEAGKDVDDATRLLAGLNNNPELKAVVAPIIHDHFNANPVTASSFTQAAQPQIKRIGQVVVDTKKK